MYQNIIRRLFGFRSRGDSIDSAIQQSNYENVYGMNFSMDRLSSSPLDVSLACSEDSTTTLIQSESTQSNIINTPAMRRRRNINHSRRNYRIMDPDESSYVLQNATYDTARKNNKILRRSSTKKENDIQSAVYITPPVLINPIQSCHLCNRGKSIPPDDMPPTVLNQSNRISEDDPSRLSFVSSSTGYSSARSSLRSSDGCDESNISNDNRIISPSTPCLSSSRRSILLQQTSLTHLDRIAIELLDTERAYVEDLSSIIQGYLNYLVDNREDLRITLDEISCLFGSIERIHSFNRKLYQQLDHAELDCIKMSQCFVENAGKFEDYISYCTNYQKMIAMLSRLHQKARLGEALASRQSYLGHALPLSAYLLKPVQRILKYHLFIENMLKHLPEETSPEGVATVKRAYEVMTTQATKINDEKKRVEHAERVEHLQTAIQKWKVEQTSNLSTYGDLLLEASFKQAGSKTARLLFLFEEMLLIVKQRGSSYVCKDYIMSSNLMLNESICIEDPLAFQVLSFDNPRVQYIFLAQSIDQKRIWMTELKRMMLDHYGIDIPEKTKQLMLSMDNTQKVAFGRPEFAEVSMKNHKKVPKYLEKRRKSMDQTEATRRRSLSASRLLGTSKSSLFSDPTRLRFGMVDDDSTKCICQTPGTSTQQHGVPSQVSRTLSASTIDLGGISLGGGNGIMTTPTIQKEIPHPTSDTVHDVITSRNRYNQARRRHLPPRQEPPVIDSKKLEKDIEKTFDDLYEELVSYGEHNPVPPKSDESVSRRVDGLVWRNETVPLAMRLRSKSLTRLDEMSSPQLSNDNIIDTSITQRPVERRFSKLDQLKRSKTRKYTINIPSLPTPEIDPIRIIYPRMSLPEGSEEFREGGVIRRDGRRSLAERWNEGSWKVCTQEGVECRIGRPPTVRESILRDNRITTSGRQRTPLTPAQAAQLENEVLPLMGLVKNMVRQLEKPT